MRYLNVLFVLLAVLAAGCSGQSGPSIPDTQPDIQGTITTLKRTATKNQPAVAVVLVEAVAGIETNYPKASVKIDDKTRLEDAAGEILKIEQLQENQEVAIWFDGPVMESFPVQAHATAVRIK